MPYHLVTVDHVHPTGLGLPVAPAVPLWRLVAESARSAAPMRGTVWSCVCPMAESDTRRSGQFGIDGWQHDGQFYTASNPQDPEFTLAVAGDLHSEDVPAGTEIWLPARQAGPSVTEAGPCSFCQMKEARERGSN